MLLVEGLGSGGRLREVDDFDTSFTDEYVVGLQVPVHHTGIMENTHSLDYLLGVVEQLLEA